MWSDLSQSINQNTTLGLDWLLKFTGVAKNDRGCNLDVNENSLLNTKQPNFLWKHRPKYVLNLCPQSKQIFRFSLVDILSAHDFKSLIISMFFGCLEIKEVSFYCLNFYDVTSNQILWYKHQTFTNIVCNVCFLITSVNLMLNIS